MKNISVTTFIHILFSLALSITIAMIFLFISWNKNKMKIDDIYHNKLIADAFLTNINLNMNKGDLEKLYKEFDVIDVDINSVKDEIERVGNTIFGGESAIGIVRIFETPSGNYIYVQRLGYNIMLKDNRPKNYLNIIIISTSLVIITLFVLLYFAILKKLRPLKKLHRDIEEFAHGNMQKRIYYNNSDEIGKIAKSFDDAIVHINTLSESKNLFMRNIMHELKTPITKSRILVESIDDEPTKNMLIKSFDRMNELIAELATIERLNTQSFKPHLESSTIDNILHIAHNLLFNDKDCIFEKIDKRVITTDIKLLSLAVKNLLDNGIKYSKDKKVHIQSNHKGIYIISTGEPLKHPLSYYTEPFSQEEKRSSGFGLGLYIVQSIVNKLGYKLNYTHSDGENIFIIDCFGSTT